MKILWLVYGETGECADYTCWDVAVFSEWKAAAIWVQKCEECAKKCFPYHSGDRFKKRDNPFDPRMQVDYTGTTYGLSQIVLDPDWPDEEKEE